jgi:uncharacterized protein
MRDSVTRAIQKELSRIEKTENVTVLYACESGSRAWGFESTDSDYDVRFIYLRRTSRYLAIDRGRDVIERPIENGIDLSGWDLIKALGLLRKSNPPLLEWIQSPVVYRSSFSLIEKLMQLLPKYYSPKACMFHYLRMAEGNFSGYLREKEVWTKKYFYVLRPVLACMWIEKELGVVPTEFSKLVDAIVTDRELRGEIDGLLAEKKAGLELRKGPRNEIISSFTEQQILRLSEASPLPADTGDASALDRLFVDILTEVNGNTIERTAARNPREIEFVSR